MGNKLGYHSTATQVLKDANVDLSGKFAIVTGANTGIGKVTARVLVEGGAHVFIGCRDQSKVDATIADIKAATGKDSISGYPLELASLKSIRKFAKKFLAQDLPLHVLILNAGIMACPLSYTKDGFEMQFGVNHLGHFLLANLLLDKIKRSSPARVVVLSSSGHTLGSICWDDINAKKSYSEWRRYGQSKLANILFARELQRQLDEEGAAVHVNCVHPGGVNTDLARHSGRFISVMAAVFFKTVEQGAATTIYAAIHPNTAQAKGVYFADCAESTTSKEACNMDDAKRLWQVSSEMVNLQSALKKCYKKQVKNESNV